MSWNRKKTCIIPHYSFTSGLHRIFLTNHSSLTQLPCARCPAMGSLGWCQRCSEISDHAVGSGDLQMPREQLARCCPWKHLLSTWKHEVIPKNLQWKWFYVNWYRRLFNLSNNFMRTDILVSVITTLITTRLFMVANNS